MAHGDDDDIDYIFIKTMKGYPASFNKNIAEYSDRDIVENS